MASQKKLQSELMEQVEKAIEPLRHLFDENQEQPKDPPKPVLTSGDKEFDIVIGNALRKGKYIKGYKG